MGILRSKTPTRSSATTASVSPSSAARNSARTTRAPTSTPRYMALTPSCATTQGAPPTSVARRYSTKQPGYRKRDAAHKKLFRGQCSANDDIYRAARYPCTYCLPGSTWGGV